MYDHGVDLTPLRFVVDDHRLYAVVVNKSDRLVNLVRHGHSVPEVLIMVSVWGELLVFDIQGRLVDSAIVVQLGPCGYLLLNIDLALGHPYSFVERHDFRSDDFWVPHEESGALHGVQK